MRSFRAIIFGSAAVLLVFCVTYSHNQQSSITLKSFNSTVDSESNEHTFGNVKIKLLSSNKKSSGNIKKSKPCSDRWKGQRQISDSTWKRWFSFGDTRTDDTRIARDQRYLTYDWPQDLDMTLRYPLRGYYGSAIITYVYITIESEHDDSMAYITEGGIGELHIAINIYAYSTRVFGWSYEVYGIYQ